MERDAMISRHPDPGDRHSALVSLTPLALGQVATVERVIAVLDAQAGGPAA